MGANAGTAVPTYASGDVLTAANLNLTNSGAPVFADTSTRDGAFGSGKKTLAEGQLCYLEDANVVQYYDGSSWATVGPSTPGGLVYITGATFTSATTVSLPNSTFTSAYRNYRILFDYTAVNTQITLRFRASGTDDSSGNYNYYFFAPTPVTQGGGTSFHLQYSSDTAGRHFATSLDVYAPQAVARSNVVYHGFTAPAAYNALQAGIGYGSFNADTQFDALTFISSSAGAITGRYRVYGYAES